jgi:hypothetical protein
MATVVIDRGSLTEVIEPWAATRRSPRALLPAAEIARSRLLTPRGPNRRTSEVSPGAINALLRICFENLAGDVRRRHGGRPTGVERHVRDHL